jgi:hypothetical protein
MLGVVPDRAAQLTHLLDVVLRPAWGAAGQLGQGHDPQRGLQDLQRPGVTSGRRRALQAVSTRRHVPQRGGQRHADRAVLQQSRRLQLPDSVNRGSHDRDRLVVGQEDVRAQGAQDRRRDPLAQLSPLAHATSQLGQGQALGQTFCGQGVLERLDQSVLLKADIVAVE